MDKTEFEGPVHLCRVRRDGNSLVLTVDKAVREALALVPRDMVGFRIVRIQNKTMILGEKVPLHKIAQIARLPAGPLPSER